jgi:hypothetical protein
MAERFEVVRKGQHWVHEDGREIVVLDVLSGWNPRVKVKNTQTGRRSTVTLEGMSTGNSGYKLKKEKSP